MHAVVKQKILLQKRINYAKMSIQHRTIKSKFKIDQIKCAYRHQLKITDVTIDMIVDGRWYAPVDFSHMSVYICTRNTGAEKRVRNIKNMYIVKW